MEDIWLPLSLFAAISLAVLAVGLVIRDLFFQTSPAAARAGQVSPAELPPLRLPGGGPPAASLAGRIDQSFERLAASAGNDVQPEAIFLAQLAVATLAGGLVYVWREDLPAALAAAGGGLAISFIALLMLRARRMRLLRDQLPDAMDALARGVRAGESLDQALTLVGETSPEPLAVEFRRCANHVGWGLSLPAAVRALARRVPLAEVRILAAALVVERTAGGRLPITLERLSRVVRDRLSYRRQFRAATAASRLATLLIASIGPLAAVYMLIWQPDYIGKFAELPGGWPLLGAAIGLQLIGMAWVARLMWTDY